MNVLDVKTQESLSRVLRQVKTSDKDYEVFKKTFMRVVEMLGLTQYEYTFTKLKNCDDDAGVAFEKFGPGGLVHLAEEVSSVVYKRGMKSLAVHKALHVLLRPYDVWLFPKTAKKSLPVPSSTRFVCRPFMALSSVSFLSYSPVWRSKLR